MSLGDTLVAGGAVLGSAAFVWDIWSYGVQKKRRRWGDDLRGVLLEVQDVTSQVRVNHQTNDWTEEHVRPLDVRLRSVAERMDQGLFRDQIEGLAGKLGVICTFSPRADEPVTVELNFRVGKQLDAARIAHERTLKFLRKV